MLRTAPVAERLRASRRPPTRLPAFLLWTLLPLTSLLLPGCATNLGTGGQAMLQIDQNYPITVGRLVESYLDTSSRLRVYLQICEDAGPQGPICSEGSVRMLAMVEAQRTSLLKRIDERYLKAGKERPVYVYGPVCDGMGEMIMVPRCQVAIALGIWDPNLRDYVFYSPRHGSGSLIESQGFNTFLEITGRAAGIARKAGAGF